MKFVRVKDGLVFKYPYSAAHFREEYPQVSLPSDLQEADLSSFGVLRIEEVQPPSASNPVTKEVVEDQPKLVDGKWVQQWVERDRPAEEVAAASREAEDTQLRLDAKADAFVQQFINMTPAQISAYIEANVTNLAGARGLLSKMCLMLLLLARREFR